MSYALLLTKDVNMGSPEVGVRTAVLRALQELSTREKENSAETCLKESDVIKQMLSVYNYDLEVSKSAIEDLEDTGVVRAESIPNSSDRCLSLVIHFEQEDVQKIKKELLDLFK